MKILIAGDYITYTPRQLKFIDEAKDQGALFGDLIPYIRESDVSIYNQELPLTDSQEPFATKKYGPILKSAPKCVQPPAQAGFTHATLATNHIYNYGKDGVRQTIETCKQNGIEPFGAGVTPEEAARPLYVEKDGLRVAFLNFAENEFNAATENHGGANPLDIVNNVKQIHEAKAQADYVFVIIHGGTDFCYYPSPRVVKQYRFYAEQGASAVIGHHAHIISGWEMHGDVPIFYCIGNLIPGKIIVPGCMETWPVQFTITREGGLEFEGIPLMMDFTAMRLRKMTGKEWDKARAQQEDVNVALKDEETLRTKWGAFLDSVEREACYFTWFSRTWYMLFRVSKKLRFPLPLYRIFVKRRVEGVTGAALWNLMRCETHRDILGYYYEKYIDKA